MAIIHMHDKIYCPLCEQPMVKKEVMVHAKCTAVWFCRPCKIGTFEFDPAFNKWRDADKTIPCPTCGNPLKWFARYTDGFFRGFCPKCKTTLSKDSEVQFGHHGNIILPDEMFDDEPEPPVEVKIPLNRLKRRSS